MGRLFKSFEFDCTGTIDEELIHVDQQEKVSDKWHFRILIHRCDSSDFCLCIL